MNGAQDRPEDATPQQTMQDAQTAEQHEAAQAVWTPPVGRGPMDPREKSPALACVLSAMPGLGQVYVGYYLRGFVHAIVVAALMAILVSVEGRESVIALFVMFLIFFWLYNIIDAGRRAAMYNQALAGNEAIELPRDFKMPGIGGSIGGGAILILAGFVLLLHTRFDVSLEWLAEWWPMLGILAGVWLLAKGIHERNAEKES